MPFLWAALGLVAGVAAGAVTYRLLQKKRADSLTHRAEERLANAQKEAERFRKEAEVHAKDDLLRRKEELERETQEMRKSLREQEKRIEKREDSLDRKLTLIEKKEQVLEKTEKKTAERDEEAQRKLAEAEKTLEEQRATLSRLSGLSRDEARKVLLDRVASEIEQEAAQLEERCIARAREDAERKSREVLAEAIQRCAADHATEHLVSSVTLPGDDMKGRIIGREGRNIRAFEKATGIDVIVDDTPGVVVVSGFDPIRREIARLSLEKLIQDGRIHPTRIEEVVKRTEGEMNELIDETGRQAALELEVPNLNKKALHLMGRLKFRTSYGQNVLQHSREVAILCQLLAAEMHIDQKLAVRIGFLHDIGKAFDHESEGGHASIGAELLGRHNEDPRVVNAVAAHHEEVPATSIYAVLVQAADAISAARPGARRESLERYVKRLERLEEIAQSHDGVERAFAIQAGREVRVIIKADKVAEHACSRICRRIAKEIEEELTYPGEVKITLIRESRFIEYAR